MRENQDSLFTCDPSKIRDSESVLQAWVPTRKIKVNDKALQKELSDNLNWWRNAGCPCSVDEVGPHDKARIEALLDLARTIEQTQGATDFFREDDVLAADPHDGIQGGRFLHIKSAL